MTSPLQSPWLSETTRERSERWPATWVAGPAITLGPSGFCSRTTLWLSLEYGTPRGLLPLDQATLTSASACLGNELTVQL